MPATSKRQVNPIIELAGAQWLVFEWDALEMDADKPLALTLYRLTPAEQGFIADHNVDWEIWNEISDAVRERFHIPQPPSETSISPGLVNGKIEGESE